MKRKHEEETEVNHDSCRRPCTQQAFIQESTPDAILLVVENGMLTLPELAALARTDRCLASAIFHAGIWSIYLTHDRLGFPREGSRLSPEDLARYYPPRRRGARRDEGSFMPLENDAAASGYVICNDNFPLRTRFDSKTGYIEDLCFPANEDPEIEHRTAVYVPRSSSTATSTCPTCSVALDSQRVADSHFRSFAHRNAMTPREKRLPAQFIDPRDKPDFDTKSLYQQAQSLFRYKIMVEDFLKVKVYEEGLGRLINFREIVQRDLRQRGIRLAEQLSLDKMVKGLQHVLIQEFHHRGVNRGTTCGALIHDGWDAVPQLGRNTYEALFEYLTGRPLFVAID